MIVKVQFTGRSRFLAIDRSLGTATSDQHLMSTVESGSASRIVLIELHESGIQWLEPKDLSIEQALTGALQLSHDAKKVNFLTADFEVGTLSADGVVLRHPEVVLKRWLSYDKRQENGE